MGRPIVDLVGNRYGKLLVKAPSERRTADMKPYWWCLCDCGVEKEIRGHNLKTGHSTSCGCERIAKIKEANTGHKRDCTFENLTGKQFGRWLVKSFSHKIGKRHFWLCECECGTLKAVVRNNLKSGKSLSCGCWQKEQAAISALKHAGVDEALYRRWLGMKSRVLNPNGASYVYYGGRGIKICDRWLNSYANFREDMGPTFDPKLSLDRIDNDGDYTPENCRWTTQSEQVKNQRHPPRGTLEERGWVKIKEA